MVVAGGLIQRPTSGLSRDQHASVRPVGPGSAYLCPGRRRHVQPTPSLMRVTAPRMHKELLVLLLVLAVVLLGRLARVPSVEVVVAAGQVALLELLRLLLGIQVAYAAVDALLEAEVLRWVGVHEGLRGLGDGDRSVLGLTCGGCPLASVLG